MYYLSTTYVSPCPGAILALSGVMNPTPDTKKQVLIVEDEQSIRDTLAELFDVDCNLVTTAELLPQALECLRTQRFDLIVTDLRLGGKRDGGLQVMALSGMLSPDATVLVLTAYPDDSNRQASARLGALHFLEKPVDLSTIAQLAARTQVHTAFTAPLRGDSSM